LPLLLPDGFGALVPCSLLDDAMIIVAVEESDSTTTEEEVVVLGGGGGGGEGVGCRYGGILSTSPPHNNFEI
jgi:hypothetical protein